eukprot:CAMPEP_0198257086 /NCGR_PEP_ID=MMETSP1447-20131203/6844_1 /TAXON_ID=420782 /ORGANISM="Chaetoceros dichaeta, Strain CCMP1751" /LENGTH=352 /DNA_ID=CAMNT_0043943893 /DNA_START=232 /DNA_END=1290 /DNA_ORIENTATION=+
MTNSVPKTITTFILTSLLFLSEINAIIALASPPTPVKDCALSRRNWIAGAAFASTTSSIVNPSYATTPQSSPPPPLILSKSSSTSPPPRIEELGAGFDLLSPPPLKAVDAIYPSSLLGLWQCQRVVVLVEGDKDQARLAWKVLGGGDASVSDDVFAKQKIERFYTKFIDPPTLPTRSTSDTGTTTKNPYGYEYQGQTLTGVVVDRVFEMESRLNEKIPQEQPTPGNTNKNTGQLINGGGGDSTAFKYETVKGAIVELVVVDRTIEAPSENGFGYNELIRITTAAGGLAPGNVIRAARVKRRFRRAFDKDGNRVVEGLEIVKTFRVLDGVAGEIPTSTTKSQIQFFRPTSTSS